MPEGRSPVITNVEITIVIPETTARITIRLSLNCVVKLTNVEPTLFPFPMVPFQLMFPLTVAALLYLKSLEAPLWVAAMSRSLFAAKVAVVRLALVVEATATVPVLVADCKLCNLPIENDLLDLFVSNRLQILLLRMNVILMQTPVVSDKTL